MRGGEELEKIAVSRKTFSELSCNSNVRTNMLSEDDRKVLRRKVCVKLKDDIHSPGEMNGQMIALKEHGYQRKRGSGRRQLQDLVPVLQREKKFTLSHS